MNKRSHIHKKADSSVSNPVKSQFQSRPFIAQAQPQSEKPLTQTQTETQEFQQHNSEATKLKLQAKYGTITSEGQERLTILQAKMSGSLQRRLQHASRFGHNFANIPISRPDALSQQAVQTKLTIGEPGDKYEQEADRVAAQVVTQINAPVSQQAGQSHPVQREEVLEEERELQMKPMLQLRSGKVGMTAAPEVEASIKQARGGGQPLAANIRQPMEQAFRADFSRVKVHTDTQADQLNQSIQAKAFTTGQDVFFRQGAYEPSSRGGQELLAHELTHVVQQSLGVVQRSPRQPARFPSVQRMPSSFGFDSQNTIGADRWKNVPRSTVLAMVSMVMEDGTAIELGTAKNTNSVTHGREHAEDVVIRTITTNLGLFKPGSVPNKLLIGLTASPCTTLSRNGLPITSTKTPPLVGCTEELIHLVQQGIDADDGQHYSFSLEINCKGLYAPSVAGSTQADVLAASQEAVNAMNNTGQIKFLGDVRPSPAQRFEVR